MTSKGYKEREEQTGSEVTNDSMVDELYPRVEDTGEKVGSINIYFG